MNNEEKANEIALKYSFEYEDEVFGEETSEGECYKSALEMAEWKDQQFIQFLEDRMGEEISVKTIEEFKEVFK